MGKVLVKVSTSEVGNCPSAKKVQSKLALLAQPRSHSAPGRHKTSWAPERRARPTASRKARPLRAKAMIRQSQLSRRRWADWLIQAVKKQPRSIHRYGAKEWFLTKLFDFPASSPSSTNRALAIDDSSPLVRLQWRTLCGLPLVRR